MKILKLGQMLGGSNSPSGGYKNVYSLDFDVGCMMTVQEVIFKVK
mgnify:CR=1 FL=1